MHTYGLIGKTLRHSWSKEYFDNKFRTEGRDDCRYLLLEGDEAVTGPAALAQWLHRTLRQERLLGFNVTIPYKQWLLPMMDALSPTAAAIGAVNCVQVLWQPDGSYRLTGHNTDAPAFAETLAPLLQPWHTNALVLGTGGAAHAVAYALRKLNIAVALVSRDVAAATARLCNEPARHHADTAWRHEIPLLSYPDAIQQAAESLLLVNATPIGMFPLISATPWPEPRCLTQRHLCYDLVYNPTETLFLQQSHHAGTQTHNGLAMLHRQAHLSWQLWHTAERQNTTYSR